MLNTLWYERKILKPSKYNRKNKCSTHEIIEETVFERSNAWKHAKSHPSSHGLKLGLLFSVTRKRRGIGGGVALRRFLFGHFLLVISEPKSWGGGWVHWYDQLMFYLSKMNYCWRLKKICGFKKVIMKNNLICRWDLVVAFYSHCCLEKLRFVRWKTIAGQWDFLFSSLVLLPVFCLCLVLLLAPKSTFFLVLSYFLFILCLAFYLRWGKK